MINQTETVLEKERGQHSYREIKSEGDVWLTTIEGFYKKSRTLFENCLISLLRRSYLRVVDLPIISL